MDLPSLKPESRMPQQTQLEECGPFGMHDTMTKGFTSVRSKIAAQHPLEASEKSYKENAQKMSLAFLQSAQGLHAPLKIMMEKKAVMKVQRLPFLPSSNIALETLNGTDEIVQVEDIFGDPMEGIEAVAPPHMVMEQHLHLF